MAYIFPDNYPTPSHQRKVKYFTHNNCVQGTKPTIHLFMTFINITYDNNHYGTFAKFYTFAL